MFLSTTVFHAKLSSKIKFYSKQLTITCDVKFSYAVHSQSLEVDLDTNRILPGPEVDYSSIIYCHEVTRRKDTRLKTALRSNCLTNTTYTCSCRSCH